MEIVLTKILEGGIDLRTGGEEPKCVILQSGHAQASMPISDEQFGIILGLLQQQADLVEPSGHSTPDEPPAPVVPMASRPTPEPEPDFEPGETYADPETGVAAF